MLLAIGLIIIGAVLASPIVEVWFLEALFSMKDMSLLYCISMKIS